MTIPILQFAGYVMFRMTLLGKDFFLPNLLHVT